MLQDFTEIYVLNLTVTSDTRSSLIADINEQKQRLECSSIRPEMLGQLWQRRILCSSSLRNGEGLAEWENASQYVALKLAAPEKISTHYLSAIQAILAPDSSGLRTEAVFSANEEYLELPTALKLFREMDATLAPYSAQPLLLAFFYYLWVVTIHPFKNGNGRCARLAADWVLLDSGYLPLTFNSPIASHVAQTKGGTKRELGSSFARFCKGLRNSYTFLLKKSHLISTHSLIFQ